MLWMHLNFELLLLSPGKCSTFPCWSYRPWAAPQGQPDQSMWNPMANTALPHPGMGGFCGGCDPNFNQAQQQQQHAMSKAQIEILKQQILLLKEQLTTQAQSHIQHLQQSMVPPPVASAPSSSQSPPTPAPAPTAKSEPASTPPTINTDEMVKKLRDELKVDLLSTLRELQEQQKKETESIPQLPSQVPTPFPFPFPAPGSFATQSNYRFPSSPSVSITSCAKSSTFHSTSKFTNPSPTFLLSSQGTISATSIKGHLCASQVSCSPQKALSATVNPETVKVYTWALTNQAQGSVSVATPPGSHRPRSAPRRRHEPVRLEAAPPPSKKPITAFSSTHKSRGWQPHHKQCRSDHYYSSQLHRQLQNALELVKNFVRARSIWTVSGSQMTPVGTETPPPCQTATELEESERPRLT